MSTHQLAPINNKELFEELICDLFNQIERTISFKRFGKNGHKQKGIDIFSSEVDIVIQCKKKDLSRKDILIRNEINNDIQDDIDKILSEKLKIKFKKIIFASTYQDHPDIDEYCESIKEEKKLNFEVIYWGWDTIENHILNHQSIIEKYFKNFVITHSSKEIEIKQNLSLKKSTR